MNNEDLIYLLAGVLREIGLDTVRLSEETIRQVLENQDQVRCWQDVDGDVIVQRKAGKVIDHGCD